MNYKCGDKIFCKNITELKSEILGSIETANLQDIAQIIEQCEGVQNSHGESVYTKQQAKIYAYNRIVEELGFRRNCQ